MIWNGERIVLVLVAVQFGEKFVWTKRSGQSGCLAFCQIGLVFAPREVWACKTYKSQFYNWAHRTKSTRWKPGVFSENGNGIQLGHLPKSTWAWVVTCLKLMEWRCSQDVRPARTPLPGSQPGPTLQCLLQCLLHSKSLRKSWNFIITMDIHTISYLSTSLQHLIRFLREMVAWNASSAAGSSILQAMSDISPSVRRRVPERCQKGWPMVTWLPSGKLT